MEIQNFFKILPVCNNTANLIYEYIKPYSPKVFCTQIYECPNSPFCIKKRSTPYYVKLAQFAIKKCANIGDLIIDNNNKYFSSKGTMFLIISNLYDQLKPGNEYKEHSFAMWRENMDTCIHYIKYTSYPYVDMFKINDIVWKLHKDDTQPYNIIDISDFRYSMEINLTQIYNIYSEEDNFSDTAWEEINQRDNYHNVVRIRLNIFDNILYLYEDVSQFIPIGTKFNNTEEECTSLINKTRWILSKTKYILFRNWPNIYNENDNYYPFEGARYDVEFKTAKLDKKLSRNCISTVILYNSTIPLNIGSLFN